MPTTITNEADSTYQFTGSTEVLTAESNENTINLENSTGLVLTKTANPTEFTVGSIITYTVNISNLSGSYLNGVRIIDNLGGGNLAYVAGSARLTVGTLTYAVTPVSTNPLTFTLQQLNVGQSMTLTYQCQVLFNLPTTVNTITNNVQGIGYTSTGTVNGFATSTIDRTNSGNFTLSKTANATNVLPGQTFNYTLTFTNSSSTSATVLNTTDQLPSNFVLTSITLRIDSGNTTTLRATDYTLDSNNLLTIPSLSGPTITVPAGSTTVITLTGFFR